LLGRPDEGYFLKNPDQQALSDVFNIATILTAHKLISDREPAGGLVFAPEGARQKKSVDPGANPSIMVMDAEMITPDVTSPLLSWGGVP